MAGVGENSTFIVIKFPPSPFVGASPFVKVVGYSTVNPYLSFVYVLYENDSVPFCAGDSLLF